MSEERKAKAAARRAARKEKKFSSTNSNEQYGGELEASKITANNEGAPNPLVGKAEVMNPNGVIPVQPSSENHSLSNVSPIQQRQAEVANPNGLVNPTSTPTNSATTMSGPKPEVNTNTAVAKPAPLEDMSKYGGELEASKSIGEDKRRVKPITSDAVVANPKGIIPVKPSNNKYNYNLDPIVGQAEVMNPNGIMPVDRASENHSLSNVPSITGKAEVMNPAGLAKPAVEQEKPLTIEDMLSAQRKKLEQDKTDAAKMQKYYALGDALKALGQMGGAAVGGAIGGNALDSAPKVAEYKPNRGYLDAFEEAKKANERLRALDNKEFSLAYNKQQKEEERAYKAEQDRITREYSAAQKEIERQWNAEQNRIKMEWQAAVADKDFERQAALKKELAEKEQAFKLKYQENANKHEADMKNISLEITKLQMGGKGSSKDKTTRPLRFNNGTAISVPKEYYEDMMDSFIGMDWNGNPVDEDNVKSFMRANPELVNDYLDSFGLGFLEEKPKADTSFPMHISQIPVDEFNKIDIKKKGKETAKNNESEDVDIFDYERK